MEDEQEKEHTSAREIEKKEKRWPFLKDRTMTGATGEK